MSGHTPGEWIATYIGNGEWEISSSGPDRDDVACVCMVAGGLGHSMEDNWDYESEANARLIAAAPELYDSLKELLEICRVKCSPHDEQILPNKTNHDAMLDACDVLDRIRKI